MNRVLITGGAGFIGSHLADELLGHGYAVRVLDSLVEQVHGEGRRRPAHLAPEAELVVGDIGDAAAVRAALAGVDAVVHLAARVGVGQSMYRMAEFVAANDLGTATLLECLIERPVARLVAASSMSVYGEGLYRDAGGRPVTDAERFPALLRDGDWEPCDAEGWPLVAMPTPESKPPALTSVYALTKYAQERMCLMVGKAYNIPTLALRFFNVYGTRQALSNPYTGVLAIFAARLLNHRPPLVYEDGLQRRDFVHVRDVARACRLALESAAAGCAVNVGSGDSHSVLEIGRALAALLGSDLAPEVTGKYRVGDIRHCFADTALAGDLLGFEARIGLEAGLAELAAWLAGQSAEDRVERAAEELTRRGLVG